jgi:antitoxin HicB
MNKYQDYLIVVTPLPDEDGGGFVARVPDLPGCFGDGESQIDAVNDVSKAIVEWIDEYSKMGRDIPHPGSMAKEARLHREAEIKLITGLRDRLREQEKDFATLDSRLDTIESDIQHLLDIVDNEAAWERFQIITKTTKSQQRELFC